MKGRGIRKTMVGTVVSDRMDKTVVVMVQRLVKHALYQKYIRRRKRYKVHDAKNDCHPGEGRINCRMQNGYRGGSTLPGESAIRGWKSRIHLGGGRVPRYAHQIKESGYCHGANADIAGCRR
jgi:small subunit ribosomal protein S17